MSSLLSAHMLRSDQFSSKGAGGCPGKLSGITGTCRDLWKKMNGILRAIMRVKRPVIMEKFEQMMHKSIHWQRRSLETWMKFGDDPDLTAMHIMQSCTKYTLAAEILGNLDEILGDDPDLTACIYNWI